MGENMTEIKARENTESAKEKNNQFQVGDLAVYPAHGVGEIQAIESRVVNGEKHDFYIMKVLENGMVIMIPISNVESVGLRDIINKKEIPKVYDIMKVCTDGVPAQTCVMNKSLLDIYGEVIVVSQFTLHASTKKGNRPSYIKAAKPDIAIPLYENFVLSLEKNINKKVQTGVFGADMKVELLNDGPVTIIIDSKNKE